MYVCNFFVANVAFIPDSTDLQTSLCQLHCSPSVNANKNAMIKENCIFLSLNFAGGIETISKPTLLFFFHCHKGPINIYLLNSSLEGLNMRCYSYSGYVS